MNKRAFNLLELMVVLIIVGILVAIAFPPFKAARENALVNEADVNLKLIQAAEKIYGTEFNHYWSYSTTSGINAELKLDIPMNNNWAYDVELVGTSDFRARAVRNGVTWCIRRNDIIPNTTCP